jgi:hypothetical protein
MWNSNSVISWLIARAGLPVDEVMIPPHGRAPGWAAGIRVARSNARQKSHARDKKTQNYR